MGKDAKQAKESVYSLKHRHVPPFPPHPCESQASTLTPSFYLEPGRHRMRVLSRRNQQPHCSQPPRRALTWCAARLGPGKGGARGEGRGERR